jgi:hypothetical protein
VFTVVKRNIQDVSKIFLCSESGVSDVVKTCSIAHIAMNVVKSSTWFSGMVYYSSRRDVVQ